MYIAMGMTYEQYWDGDTEAHRAYLKAYKIQMADQNKMAWIQGLYVYEAIGALAPMLKAFAKGRARPYVKEPFDLFADEREAREEREAKERYERVKMKVAQFARAQKEKREKESEQKEVDADAGSISERDQLYDQGDN